ncbi:MAG: NAD(P)H-binding protein [Terriglobia bacterium]
MRIAITGGTGFVGRHLARSLASKGHEVVLVARGIDRRDESIRQLDGAQFAPIGTDDEEALARAFAGCDGIAHCAGINREIGAQTYKRVHVEGTRNVVNAAKRAGVKKVVLLSFLRARPDCGSAYHESKWAAEEIIRASDLDYTVIKAGVIYGKGDHMLDHLSHALQTFPVFGLVGMKDTRMRPLAVEDLVRVIEASLIEGRLSRTTVAVTGPEEMPLGEAVRRVAGVLGRHPVYIRLPVFLHYALAWVFDRVMTIPLVSVAQVRILSEGIVTPLPACELLPAGLLPQNSFNEQQIRQGLPEIARFGLKDCRWSA